MCDPITAVVAGSAILGAGASIYQGNKAEKQAKKAASQAQVNADKQAAQADQAFNKANAKMPNTQNIQDETAQAALSGASSTMLTGPQGVDPKTLLLGRNSLLGQ